MKKDRDAMSDPKPLDYASRLPGDQVDPLAGKQPASLQIPVAYSPVLLALMQIPWIYVVAIAMWSVVGDIEPTAVQVGIFRATVIAPCIVGVVLGIGLIARALIWKRGTMRTCLLATIGVTCCSFEFVWMFRRFWH